MAVESEPVQEQSGGPPHHLGAISIRLAASMSDMEKVSNLQGQLWGPPVAAPPTLLKAIAAAGGIVLLAETNGEAVGFTYGFVGRDESGTPYHRSHAAATLPNYRDRGLGAALKHAQRERALQQGLTRMVWTFDPAQTKNAHFNLHRLEATARAFHPNYYGARSDAQNLSGRSDRMVAEWLLLDVERHQLTEELKGSRPAARVAVPELLPVSESPSDEQLQAAADLAAELDHCFGRGWICGGYDAPSRSYLFYQPPVWLPPALESKSDSIRRS